MKAAVKFKRVRIVDPLSARRANHFALSCIRCRPSRANVVYYYVSASRKDAGDARFVPPAESRGRQVQRKRDRNASRRYYVSRSRID